jgi:uncharacterized protein (DUF2147 family)
MKRFCYFVALMALSSSAQAGDSFSFVFAGHRIWIEAPRHCRSASCVSVSIPGIYRSGRRSDRDDDVAAAPEPAPVNPPARAATSAPAVAAQPSQPPVQPAPLQPVAAAPAPLAPPPPAPPPLPVPQLASTTAKIVVLLAPPPLPAPIAATTQPAVPPPPPKVEPVKTAPAAAPPVVVPKPIPVPTPVPQISKVSQETKDEPADTPLGDWQTEGNKGAVRVERCGQAMCGYILNLASNAKGDTILINMKPKSKTAKSGMVWSGNIYSRSSGATYYATMTMNGENTLRVEACALGRFFCSGNDWTRMEKASRMMTYQETSSRPPS